MKNKTGKETDEEKEEEEEDEKETAVDEANRKDVCQTAFVRPPRIERPRSLWNICHPSRSNGTAAE